MSRDFDDEALRAAYEPALRESTTTHGPDCPTETRAALGRARRRRRSRAPACARPRTQVPRLPPRAGAVARGVERRDARRAARNSRSLMAPLEARRAGRFVGAGRRTGRRHSLAHSWRGRHHARRRRRGARARHAGERSRRPRRPGSVCLAAHPWGDSVHVGGRCDGRYGPRFVADARHDVHGVHRTDGGGGKSLVGSGEVAGWK